MKFIKRILLTLVLLFTLVGCSQNQGSGEAKVELVALDGSVIKEVNVVFDEEDTLTDIIKDNFNNVVFESGMLMEIEDYVTPSNWETFISVYVNGKMSMVGISDIILEDGIVVSLIITEFIS